MKHRPQAILFDWDNTLVATADVLYSAISHTLEQLDKPALSRDQAYQNMHQTPQGSFTELFGIEAPQAMVIFYKFINGVPMAERFTPTPGAASLLAKIKQADIPMGVVSNKKTDILHAEINFIGWQDYFQTIIGSGDARADKPSPEPLNLALHRMQLTPSPMIWFIGDSPVDWACAQQSGCKPFSFHVPSSDPDVSHVTHFHHLEEIIDFKQYPRLPA